MSLKILYSKINNNLKIILLLAVVFFVIYSFFSFKFPTKFNSPDEGANFFFINNFIQNSTFQHTESLNIDFNGLIHPRNARAIDNNIVPYSFLGMYIILGFLGKLFTAKIIYFIVPFFSSLSVIFFYLALRKIFPERIAFISGLLLFIHPAFWYLSSLPFYHNALFAAFLIISFYFLISAIFDKKTTGYIFFGIFLSLTLITRTSEVIWILALLFTVLWSVRSKLSYKKLILSVVCFIIILSPMLYYNNQIYGNPLTVGYLASSNTAKPSDLVGAHTSPIDILSKIFFPKGIVIEKLQETISKYLINIYILFTSLTILGIILIIFDIKKYNSKQKAYLCSLIFITIYLVLYYGSGSFFGARGDMDDTTTASSMIRYWLPIYVFSLPIIAIFIEYINRNLTNKRLRLITIVSIFLAIITTSISIAYLDKNAGLIKMNKNSILYNEINQELDNYTSQDDVFITTGTDKFIFPEHRVVSLNNYLDKYTNDSLRMNGIKKLATTRDVYYFTIYGIDYIQTNKLIRPYGLKLKPITAIKETTSLYKFDLIAE